MSRPPEDLAARIRFWRETPRGRPARIELARPDEESVWDYPRPPRVEPVTARVRVELDGEVLADSRRALRVLETASPPTFYLPCDDVRDERLVVSPHTTLCEWKGLSRHHDYRHAGRHVPEVAWSYPEPLAGFEVLRGHLAFYAGRVDACWVGEDRVVPQPGGFYGGWITPGIVGPWKGEPGSEGW